MNSNRFLALWQWRSDWNSAKFKIGHLAKWLAATKTSHVHPILNHFHHKSAKWHVVNEHGLRSGQLNGQLGEHSTRDCHYDLSNAVNRRISDAMMLCGDSSGRFAFQMQINSAANRIKYCRSSRRNMSSSESSQPFVYVPCLLSAPQVPH